MKRGEVFFRKQFQFLNGTKINKLLIALNDLSDTYPVLAVLTTSQQWIRNINHGCYYLDNYFTIQKDYDLFTELTWVLFTPLLILNSKQILQWGLVERNLETIGHLKANTIRSILNCIQNSPDIPIGYLPLLK